jgi:hypothetical protein
VGYRACYFENVPDATPQSRCVDEKKVALHRRSGHAPKIVVIDFPQSLRVLRLDRLKPDIKAKAKLLPQFHGSDARRNTGPVMNPADDPVAISDAVFVSAKIVRPILKLDADALTLSVGDAIGKTGTYFLDVQSKFLSCKVGEKIDNTLFVVGGVIERSAVGQAWRAFSAAILRRMHMLSSPASQRSCNTANLLVVILHVEIYKTGGGKSRQILPRPWPESQDITRKVWLQPRGHDFLRIFGAALAAD